MDAGLPLKVPPYIANFAAGRCLGGEGVEEVLLADNGPDGVAAAYHFAHGRKVGGDAVILLGSTPGEPEPGHHLVENKYHVASAGDVPEPFQKLNLWRDVPLYRLHDDRCQLILVALDKAGGGLYIVEGGHQYEICDGVGDALRVAGRVEDIRKVPYGCLPRPCSRGCRDSRPPSS